jgi:hypothetical protein
MDTVTASGVWFAIKISPHSQYMNQGIRLSPGKNKNTQSYPQIVDNFV